MSSWSSAGRVQSASGNLWGIILAGGEGRRLRPLMRRMTGQDIPKQFGAFLGRRTMLQQTLDRVATAIPLARIITVITREYLQLAREQLPDVATDHLIVQPANRETAPGLLLPLLSIGLRDPTATVAVFPSDHFIREEDVFMDHVRQAVAFLGDQPDLVVLLGIAPDRAETAYGWVEPGEEAARWKEFRLFRVRQFWEKPSRAVAQEFYSRGYLWNSLVLVGRLAAFLHCYRRGLPAVWGSLQQVVPALGTSREVQALETAYRDLPSTNLSRDLLEPMPHRLGVVPVQGVQWSDWGEEERILESLARMGQAEGREVRVPRPGALPGREAA